MRVRVRVGASACFTKSLLELYLSIQGFTVRRDRVIPFLLSKRRYTVRRIDTDAAQYARVSLTHSLILVSLVYATFIISLLSVSRRLCRAHRHTGLFSGVLGVTAAQSGYSLHTRYRSQSQTQWTLTLSVTVSAAEACALALAASCTL